MAKEPVYLTPQGKAELEEELTQLLTVGRPQIAATILAAREDGDLKENGAYHDAKDRQGHLEGRIRTIKAKLDRATLIPPPPTRDSVSLGSIVTIIDATGAKETYTIVGSTEAKVLAGRISNESPLGRALIGRKVGQPVTVKAPQGDLLFTVGDIDWTKEARRT
ncbi:MAG: transcription elongation factor GreA [Chloroflexota bacterium]|nr:transcription elongation factor GreA [Chloroflexota bacterium]